MISTKSGETFLHTSFNDGVDWIFQTKLPLNQTPFYSIATSMNGVAYLLLRYENSHQLIVYSISGLHGLTPIESNITLNSDSIPKSVLPYLQAPCPYSEQDNC